MAAGGEGWLENDGEVAWAQEGRGKEGKAVGSNLTPLRSSCGGLLRGRSGGPAARRAAEARQWQAAEELGVLGFLGRKAAAATWGEVLGHGALK
jgi:hypothetical protein